MAVMKRLPASPILLFIQNQRSGTVSPQPTMPTTRLRPIIDDKNVEEGLRHSLPERAHKLIPLNMEAVKVGKYNVK